MPVYNINSIESANILKTSTDDSTLHKNFSCKNWTFENDTYKLIKYNKKTMSEEQFPTIGLLRSVITKNGKTLCYSPPKSLRFDTFIKKYNEKDCVAQEYIEGTMINLFYDSTAKDNMGDWQISTKSAVGADVGFSIHKNKKICTFRNMFLDTCNHVNLDFEALSKNHCYSFVMQHPNNVIVSPVNEKKLYLISVYTIDNETLTVKELSKKQAIELMSSVSDCRVQHPHDYEMTSYLTIKNKWASYDTTYTCQGIVIKHLESGERTKIRNPNFEYVKKLKGNQPKLLFRYLQLRQTRTIQKYLTYFPHDKAAFDIFRNQIHAFSEELHDYYLKYHVHKIIKLNEIPSHFKPHIYAIHGIYLNELRVKKYTVQKYIVIDYVNALPPARLMKSLNMPLQRDVSNDDICEKAN